MHCSHTSIFQLQLLEKEKDCAHNNLEMVPNSILKEKYSNFIAMNNKISWTDKKGLLMQMKIPKYHKFKKKNS